MLARQFLSYLSTYISPSHLALFNFLRINFVCVMGPHWPHCFAQADHQLLSSRDPPASAPQVAGTGLDMWPIGKVPA
jgi:hypothetical protein